MKRQLRQQGLVAQHRQTDDDIGVALLASGDKRHDVDIGLRHNYDVHDIRVSPTEHGFVLDVTIANRCLAQLQLRRRRLTGATGCGICCVEAVEQAFPPLPSLPLTPPLDSALLAGLRPQIARWQLKGQHSGALHAALVLDEQVQIFHCREDIGRHNALDKLIGLLLCQKLACDTLVVTSRCGGELVQKNSAVRRSSPRLPGINEPAGGQVGPQIQPQRRPYSQI